MRRLFSTLLRLLPGSPAAGQAAQWNEPAAANPCSVAGQVHAADRDFTDIDEMLTRAAGQTSEPAADWITVLHRDFQRLPILPALALLHYINPNDAKAKTIERLKDAPLDDFARTLLAKWRSDRIDSASLSLAMAVEYCGVRHEKVEYLALADAIRMMSLSNRSIAMPDSAESSLAIASCAATVAQALVRDSRELFGRTDLNREMLANLAFICLGWRSASANMTRFTGSERSFNHIAFGIGHELSRSPDVFNAVALAETPLAPLEQEHAADVTNSGPPPFVDHPGPDEIPSCFDGAFEDPIIEDLPADNDAAFRLSSDDEPNSFYEDGPMPLPPDPEARRAAPESNDATGGSSLLICGQPLKDRRTVEIAAPHRHVIGTPVALSPTPDLVKVRQQLAAEFPYALEAIDKILNEMVGRPTIKFEPLLLFGPPGAGKSRFCRRLSSILGTGLIRVDASRSDGNVFGGTDRRWSSAEPCHPFLAISRSRIANPIMLIEEIEKAAVRTDYGRLWDCLLSFLEVETAQCYPDPALQTEVDVSNVSYLFTANDLDNLPHVLRDRLEIIKFPEPKAEHLNALLKPVFDDYLRHRRIDPAWAPPLSQIERAALAARWTGGSVRKLNRLMAGVMRAREKSAIRH